MGIDKSFSRLVSSNPKRLTRLARHTGFKLLLAWHFIVLFTPQFAAPEAEVFDDFVFARQLTLYLSLALCFLVLGFVRRRLSETSKPGSRALLHGSVGLLSVLATSAAIAVSTIEGVPMGLCLITIAVLGCCEAASIHLWIHYLVETGSSRQRRSLIADMVSGAVIAFFTLSLNEPLSYVVVAVIPGLAAFSLLIICSSGHTQAVEPRVVIPAQAQRMLNKRFVRNHLPSVVFALTFGLLQGTFIEIDILFFMATSPLVLLGVLVSGLIMYVINERTCSYEDIDTMHRFSLILLVLGVLGISFLREFSPVYLSKASFLAGFVLFDFGALVLSMNMTWRAGFNKAYLINTGRSMVYIGFALGLTIGFVCCRFFDESYNSLLISTFSGVAVALLVATILMRLYKTVPAELVLIDEATRAVAPHSRGVGIRGDFCNAESGEIPKKTWQETCAEVARIYRLSPRETEVFMLLGKGRNAEYIQTQLVISLHTAKSHIANIYQKLGVHSIQEMLDLIELFEKQ